MISKPVTLYLSYGFPVRVPVSQFDTMWQFVFSIIKDGLEWEIPTGASVVMNGVKPDGNVFAFAGTVSNNNVTVNCDVQMTACAGNTECELSIVADGKTVGTCNFILQVEAAPKSPDDISSDSTLPAYEEMLDQLSHTATMLFPNRIKQALLACFNHVAWDDQNGDNYYTELQTALYDMGVVSISAVFTQGTAVIYTHDSLDTLRQYLTVTALLDDGETEIEVSSYTLSGTLTAGTSTITVTFGGKTTTFDVTVTAGVPSSYTIYDYIQSNAPLSSAYSVPFAGQLRLKTYENLNNISCEFAYAAIAGHPTGGCIWGRRVASGATSSFAFYAGTNKLGYHIHGSDTGVSIDALDAVKHIVKYTTAASSPSTLQVDGGNEYSIVWSNNNTINADPCLLSNPTDNTTNFNLSYGTQCGYIKIFDASGNLLNHYFPVLREADSVIGMYDIVDGVFYTTSTASYATVGNANQKYKIGNW